MLINYFTLLLRAECGLEGTSHGTAIAVDELAEMLTGFNQYKGGKGNDRQKWLTIYDSGEMKVDRSSGKRMFLTHTPLSILGTIQPDVLKQQMGDLYTVDGLWQRFLWVNLPVTRLPAPGDGITCNISELLLGVYRRLENLPALSYGISTEARKLWKSWHDWCETQKLAEAHPSIRTIYPKARERAARIALVFHIVEAVTKNQMTSQEISATTMNAAIQFVQWTIKQTRLLYADLGITKHQDSAKITRFVERFRYADWITAKQVRSWIPAKQKPSCDQCREFMQQIVNMGYATNNGQTGREYKIKILTCSHFSPDGSQTQTEMGIERSPDEALTPKWTKWTTPIDISVGDRVGYRGKGENGLFTLKGLKTDVLTVVAISGDMVEVSSPCWLTSQNIPAKDLERI